MSSLTFTDTPLGEESVVVTDLIDLISIVAVLLRRTLQGRAPLVIGTWLMMACLLSLILTFTARVSVLMLHLLIPEVYLLALTVAMSVAK